MAAPIRAALMITCLGDVLFPEVGVAMVRLLRRLGVEVEFPEGQTCCGMPLFNSGYHHDAALVAAAGVEHGLVNDSADLLLVLVMVAPPPPHMKR